MRSGPHRRACKAIAPDRRGECVFYGVCDEFGQDDAERNCRIGGDQKPWFGVHGEANAIAVFSEGSQGLAKVRQIGGKVYALSTFRPAEQLVDPSHGVETILRLLEMGLHRFIWLTPSLNAQEGSSDGEAVLSSV